MRIQAIRAGLSAGLTCLALAAGAQTTAPKVDAGRQEYLWHCASCHGPAGAGNGELRRFLTRPPSDLTTLSKRNGGAFPNQLVWDVIDGRSAVEVPGHGAREMPVWGQRYRAEAMSQPGTEAAPEWYVRNRIVALLDYLSRIQAQ
jgi:mono/diheme cytochrome c family protein